MTKLRILDTVFDLFESSRSRAVAYLRGDRAVPSPPPEFFYNIISAFYYLIGILIIKSVNFIFFYKKIFVRSQYHGHAGVYCTVRVFLQYRIGDRFVWSEVRGVGRL